MLCCAHLNRKVAWLSFVGTFCHQSLAFSGFIVLSKQLGTQKKTRLNHDDVIDLQVIALERGRIYNSELDDRSKHPSCLELTEVRFCSSELRCFEHGKNHASLTAWPMLNVYHFKLGKEPLNPRVGTTQPLH